MLPAALGGLYARRLPALASPEAWRDPASIAALDRPYAEILRGFGASDEAVRLINANLNGFDVTTMSALHIARTAAVFRGQPGPVRVIGGGSQRLPEAMAAALSGDVRLDSAVTQLAEDRHGVTVTVAGQRAIRGRHVICTVPFAAMRPAHPAALRITSDLAPEMRQAIAAIPYTGALFYYLSARTAFWRDDGYPPTLWSDDPMIGRVFVLGADPPVLKVWITGQNLGRAYIIDAARNGAAAIAAIERARPSARGQLSLLRRWDWQVNRFAGGIYHHIGAGEAATQAAATAHQGRRLHFAGEHLAVAASGMEGALESGERAAQTVLALG